MENKEKMSVLYNVNNLENKKLIIILNLMSIPLLIIFGILFKYVALFFGTISSDMTRFSLLFPLLILVLFIGLILIHEAIHGFFFKLFNPEKPVKYGVNWKSGMAYATSPGSLYTRKEMVIIGIAPFVLISLTLTILVGLKMLNPLMFLSLATLHAASCVGDFYYIYLLLIKFSKPDIRVEDTETGLIIYQV